MVTKEVNETSYKNIKHSDRAIIFRIFDNHFNIEFYYMPDKDGDYTEINQNVTKDEFILYLTQLFYNHPEVTLIDKEGENILYKDLK